MLTLTKIPEGVGGGQFHVLESDFYVLYIRCQEQAVSGASTGLLGEVESALAEVVAVLVKFHIGNVTFHPRLFHLEQFVTVKALELCFPLSLSFRKSSLV